MRGNYNASDAIRILGIALVIFTIALSSYRVPSRTVETVTAPPTVPDTVTHPVMQLQEITTIDTLAVARRLIVAFDSASLSFDAWERVRLIRPFWLRPDNDYTLRYDDIDPTYVDLTTTELREPITTSGEFVNMLSDVSSVLRRKDIQELVFVGAPLFTADTTMVGEYIDAVVNRKTAAGVVPQIHVVYHEESTESVDIIKAFVDITMYVSRTANVQVHRLRPRQQGS